MVTAGSARLTGLRIWLGPYGPRRPELTGARRTAYPVAGEFGSVRGGTSCPEPTAEALRAYSKMV